MLRRGHGRRRNRELAAGRESTQQAEGDAESSLDLMQMLDTLDDEDRALLILKYAQGHSYDELAEMFELSVSACKMWISRARDRLRQRFPEHQFHAIEGEV